MTLFPIPSPICFTQDAALQSYDRERRRRQSSPPTPLPPPPSNHSHPSTHHPNSTRIKGPERSGRFTPSACQAWIPCPAPTPHGPLSTGAGGGSDPACAVFEAIKHTPSPSQAALAPCLHSLSFTSSRSGLVAVTSPPTA